MSSRYQNLNLHNAIHYDLQNTFFHQLLKKLIGNDQFKRFLATDQLINSLFQLFNVETASKSRFAGEFNRYLTEMHMKIEELLQHQPDLKTSAQAEALVNDRKNNQKGVGQREHASDKNAAATVAG